MEPQSLLAAVRYFSDRDVCNAYMRKIKWPNGKIACPVCGSTKIGDIASRRMLQCKDCRKQFSHKTGTIMEDSAVEIGKWLAAIYASLYHVSSVRLSEALGVTQKTAWLMLNRIRAAKEVIAMQDERWLPVVGFEGYYEVSDCGRVRAVERISVQAGRYGGSSTRTLTAHVLRQKQRKDNGYCEVTLKSVALAKSEACLVHRLVLEAFVGLCPEGQQARHFPDRSRANNRLDNLAWGTPKANQADRIAQGTRVDGERCHLHRLTADQVRAMRARLDAGEKIRAVAADFDVDEATAGHIKARRSWKLLV
jgi:transposase-like protein